MLKNLSKIRVRLVLGFFCAFLGMTLFGALSYRYFVGVEHRLYFLSQADNMLNSVLEVRRYEKNYFLYHHEKDFQQALSYLQEFQDLLASEKKHVVESQGKTALPKLERQIDAYGLIFAQVHQMLSFGNGHKAWPPDLRKKIAALRSAGQYLISFSEDLARKERVLIKVRLREYGPLLIAFLLSLGIIGSLIAYYLSARLFKPLQTIEEATRVVAEGEYQVIPSVKRQDEIGTLVQAFNRMVSQLRHNNEQVIQTEKLTSLGTLTSGVAHELNNPLNNISISCQILLEELHQEVSPYHRELLQAIEGQVNRARDIVGSLLEFARQREFELRHQDLREVVEGAIRLIQGDIPREVKVSLQVPHGIVVRVDKAHLVQALINLILNGIQAMEQKGTLVITGRIALDGEHVFLEVQDTGTGISPEVLPRIFDPFFTTKEVGQGTGLGLAITYGIVERHQGHIRVESEPGKGTNFIVQLPLDRKVD